MIRIKFRLICSLIFTLLTTLIADAQDYRWQQKVKYYMDVELDVQSHRLKGSQRLVIYNNSPDTLAEVFFHLYFNAFQPGSDMDIRSRSLPDPDRRVRDRISKLNQDEMGYTRIKKAVRGKSTLNVDVEGTIARVGLDSPLMPGDSVSISMEFEAQVPVQIRRSGRYNKEGVAYSMSQWYPKLCNYDEHGWHTDPYVGREFYAPWGDFEVNITLASSFCVAATGYLQNPGDCDCNSLTKSSQYRTWKFLAPNVHDFVWAADPDFRHDVFKRADGRVLQFYYKKDQAYDQAWKDLQPIMNRALDLVEGKIGPYPYQTYSFIQGGDGGMEYSMATLITGNRPLISLVGVAVHEWLHSWFQMVLASNESLYPWMDEGFTAYMEEEIMNQLKGEGLIPGAVSVKDPHAETLADFKAFAGTASEEPLSTHADHYSTSRAYGIGSYVKGALCLHHIRYMVGDNAFWTGIRRYYELWKFRHPNPDDFFRIMEKASGLELDWFKLYWVNTVKTIDYAISSVEQDGRQTVVNLERKGQFPMPVVIRVILKDGAQKDYEIPLDLMMAPKNSLGTERVRQMPWHWVAAQYRLKLDFPRDEISKIQLDPSRMLADVDESNDQWVGE